MTHEFIKLLHARYGAEKIEIPYPKRDLYLKTVPVTMKRKTSVNFFHTFLK